MPTKSHTVIFVSYARKDASDFAWKLTRALRDKGYIVFLDVDTIKGGDEWRRSLAQGLSDATHLIAVLTPNSVDSEWCNWEWDEAKNQRLPIIPVLYRDYALPQVLADLHYIDFRDDTRFTEHVANLVDSIETRGQPLTKPLKYWKNLLIMNFAPSSKDVVCISGDKTVAQAFHIISKELKFTKRHLLISHKGSNIERLEGIVGSRNLEEEMSNNNEEELVRNIMIKCHPHEEAQPTCVWLYEDATIMQALEAFLTCLTRASGVSYFFYMSAIPIVDKDFNVVSIVSFKDILNAMLNQIIPIPDIKLSDMNYLAGKDVVIGRQGNELISLKTKTRVRRLGQRDIPIVDEDNRLIGLIPDNILITNCREGVHVDVDNPMLVVPFKKLRNQVPRKSLEDTLKQYMSENENQSQIFYSFPVITNESEAQFLGLIGYRDILKSIMAIAYG